MKQESFAFWGEQKGNLAGSFALSDAEWSLYMMICSFLDCVDPIHLSGSAGDSLFFMFCSFFLLFSSFLIPCFLFRCFKVTFATVCSTLDRSKVSQPSSSYLLRCETEQL